MHLLLIFVGFAWTACACWCSGCLRRKNEGGRASPRWCRRQVQRPRPSDRSSPWRLGAAGKREWAAFAKTAMVSCVLGSALWISQSLISVHLAQFDFRNLLLSSLSSLSSWKGLSAVKFVCRCLSTSWGLSVGSQEYCWSRNYLASMSLVHFYCPLAHWCPSFWLNCLLGCWFLVWNMLSSLLSRWSGIGAALLMFPWPIHLGRQSCQSSPSLGCLSSPCQLLSSASYLWPRHQHLEHSWALSSPSSPPYRSRFSQVFIIPLLSPSA